MKTLFALLFTFALHSAAFAQATADDLKKQIATLQAAIAEGKTDEAAKLTSAFFPNEARLKKGLADNVPADAITKALGLYASLPKEPAQLAKVMAGKPGQTEIQVHGATTEEIAKHADGSVAFKEFPGSAKDLASKGILRPGLTYYAVELLEPGKDAGMKFHLFYHDGTAWTTLGPLWRVLK
jgi:hypothetical protein